MIKYGTLLSLERIHREDGPNHEPLARFFHLPLQESLYTRGWNTQDNHALEGEPTLHDPTIQSNPVQSRTADCHHCILHIISGRYCAGMRTLISQTATTLMVARWPKQIWLLKLAVIVRG